MGRGDNNVTQRREDKWVMNTCCSKCRTEEGIGRGVGVAKVWVGLEVWGG